MQINQFRRLCSSPRDRGGLDQSCIHGNREADVFSWILTARTIPQGKSKPVYTASSGKETRTGLPVSLMEPPMSAWKRSPPHKGSFSNDNPCFFIWPQLITINHPHFNPLPHFLQPTQVVQSIKTSVLLAALAREQMWCDSLLIFHRVIVIWLSWQPGFCSKRFYFHLLLNQSVALPVHRVKERISPSPNEAEKVALPKSREQYPELTGWLSEKVCIQGQAKVQGSS